MKHDSKTVNALFVRAKNQKSSSLLPALSTAIASATSASVMQRAELPKRKFKQEYNRSCLLGTRRAFKSEFYGYAYGSAGHKATIKDAVEMYHMGGEL